MGPKTDFYDENNRHYQQTGSFDDGRTSSKIWDVDNKYDWAKKHTIYDSADNYDWDSKSYFYNANGDLINLDVVLDG